ncbi:MAG: hcaR 3 [Acidimicrobiaceae bacterium]|nr:hcaR 3 [Acidimicrobiaceae bacterium]
MDVDIDLRSLRYFVAVAEDLHFSRAAARLHLDQPTLSRHVRRLERDMGVELLTRTTRSVVLTSVGEVFLEKAREALSAADAAVVAACEAAAGQAGVLRVGMLVQIAPALRAEAFATFEQRYPNVEVRPIGGFPYVDPTFGLAAGETDVAFVWDPIRHPQIETRALFQEPRFFIFAENHPLARRSVVRLEEVEDEAFFGFPPEYNDDPTAATWSDFYQLQPRPDGRRRPVGAEVTNRDEWVDALTRGKAISTTPATTAANHPWPGVSFVLAEGIEPTTVSIAWRRDRSSPVVSNFVHLVQAIAAR